MPLAPKQRKTDDLSKEVDDVRNSVNRLIKINMMGLKNRGDHSLEVLDESYSTASKIQGRDVL
jgi:hypothetical protein